MGKLLDLKQGSDSVSQYANNFRILAAESGWDDSALQAVFQKGLACEIKDELALREESPSLNQLIELSIRLDNRLRERSRERQEDRRRRLPTSHQPATSSDSMLALTTLSSPTQKRFRLQLMNPCSWEGRI